MDATALSQSGIELIGNSALLAKSSGRFRRFITAIWLSQLVDLNAMERKIAESPRDSRNRAAKTPSTLIRLTAGPRRSPSSSATPRMIAAWMRERMMLLKTFDIMMDPRATGVVSTLLRKPRRLSHTIDMPLVIDVKRTMNESIPTAMNEK